MADHVTAADFARRKSSSDKSRTRQNSLRKTKNSTDLLRRQKLGKELGLDLTSEPKEHKAAGKFALTNVGGSGLIFLRPVQSAKADPPRKLSSPEPLPQEPMPQNTLAPPNRRPQLRESIWTNASAFSRAAAPDLSPQQAAPPVRRQRSFSQSTAEAIKTRGERLEDGAFKIVIDRTGSVPGASLGPDANGEYPSLQVSIPHYRLGTPRFSAMGTAFLHQSTYTRSSVTGGDAADADTSSVFSGGEFDRGLARLPMGLDAQAVLSRRHSHASPQPYSIQTTHAPSYSIVSPYAYASPASTGPISPHTYDQLAQDPHNPSVVKYSPISGDIVAATPARIVAQVTSENFLDYELLSDFFLTVRSYLSTQDLLAYLMARFEWAINRFDDTGRVIRVRAFAALRHWILNYFSYDFVVDRDLRVQFCARLNALAKVVKARAGYGASDMKLIVDLKKCWNGRCALFWDHPQHLLEGQQDADIQPGGIVGSRDSHLVSQNQLRFTPFAPLPPAGLNPAQLTAGTPSLANWYAAVMEHSVTQTRGHNRQTSTATSRSLPMSPTSEISMPIVSCSIPARSFRRAFPYHNRELSLHPVPTDAPGPQAPSHVPAAHSQGQAIAAAERDRRSGSFSDAARDQRAQLSSELPEVLNDTAQAHPPLDTSLIRGYGIVPGSPLVRAIPVTYSPPRSARSSGNPLAREREVDQPFRKMSTAQSPAVKNILGNIRRALSSKHSTTPMNAGSRSVGGNGSSVPTLTSGRSAQLPLNVMYKASSSGYLDLVKPATRIDLLAEEIYHTYRDAYSRPIELPTHHAESIGVALGNESQQPSPMTESEQQHPSYDLAGRLKPPELRRLQSAMTDSSQSILIVDDTGAPNNLGFAGANPAMALINTMETPGMDQDHESPPDGELSIVEPDHASEEIQDLQSEPAPAELHSESLHGPTCNIQPRNDAPLRPPLARNHSGSRATKNSSISLRRYASFQSTFSKHGHNMSIDTGLSRRDDRASSIVKVAPARALRRRPGGDLRANQNVHDLKERPRPKSAGSITTYSESVRESIAASFGGKLSRMHDLRRSSLRIATSAQDTDASAETRHSIAPSHSSMPEKRRPSFEAAVAEFARIPDDEDGGIEVTLLKLEGKYKSPVQSPLPPSQPETARPSNPEPPSSTEPDVDSKIQSSTSGEASPKSKDVIGGIGQKTSMENHLSLEDDEDEPEHHAAEDRGPIGSTIYAQSEDSFNSVPLLERGEEEHRDDSDAMNEASGTDLWDPHRFSDDGFSPQRRMNQRNLRYGSVAPTATTDSFLLDEEDDFLSDLSSEFSMDTVEPADPETPPGEAQRDTQDITPGRRHPPSPAMSKESAGEIGERAQHVQEEHKPPTPDPSPVAQPVVPDMPLSAFKRDPKAPKHMPFILGFETDAIVQQLTLIEKDALREIDWRDLVAMRWQTTATVTTNWVEYMLTRDPLGVDLVTARFNIMVKWALSEIMLTENVEERALVIVKYIHIAQQARTVHNYATLLQMTIALTSADCNRLGKTWNLVPEAEKDMLQDLELLVSPKKNFHYLRSEMEKANSERGCIPVVALYLHDLTYNAQKPGVIPAPVGDGEPLINFERHRSAAVIVKSLLRLIDASTKYDYVPIDGLIDRCLWMAALPDEVIASRSKMLEWGAS